MATISTLINNTANPAPAPASTEPPTKKHKKKDTHIMHTSTFRRPLYAYLHLRLTTVSPSAPASSQISLDPLTTRTLLTSPLQAYLGITGSAIPIDILKLAHRDVWIRVPRQDVRVVQASLSAWAGSADKEMVPGVAEGEVEKWGRVRVNWRVVGMGESLALLQGDGMDLFKG